MSSTSTTWTTDSLTKATNSTITDGDPNILSSTLTVGFDGTGYDVKFFGDTASAYMLWDESADDLILSGGAGLVQSGAGAITLTGATQINNTLTVGANTDGHDAKFFGNLSGSYMLWNESRNELIFSDNALISLGTDSDCGIKHDGSNASILNTTGNLAINTSSGALGLGSGVTGIAVVVGHTTSETTIGDNLTITGTLIGGRSSVESVTATDSLTAAESGKIFVFADAAAVLTLPDSGAGDIIGVTFTFISNFQGTGQEVICADISNEIIVGNLIGADDDGDGAPLSWNAQVSDGFSSIEFTSVSDGKIGSFFTVTCYAADRWLVHGVVNQSGGSEATPFAAS